MCLAGAGEILLSHAALVVRAPAHRHPLVADLHVGMVIRRLGVEGHARHERDRVRKRCESELPDDGVAVEGPAWQVAQPRIDLLAGQSHCEVSLHRGAATNPSIAVPVYW